MQAAAVFPGKRSVEVVSFDEPGAVSATQVKLRILEVGVCGTDREICTFEYGTPPSGFEFLVIGHESLGEVVDAGSDVTRFKQGDLVIPMVRRPCDDPECTACRAGRQDFCYTGRFRERGIKEQHGFMTELVADEERYMNPIPAELRDVGVLVEPLTIAEKALIQVRQIQQRLPWNRRHRAVVIGAGPVGLLGAMVLVNADFDTYVYSRSNQPKADVAESFGAKFISTENGVEQLAAEVGNIDIVYEAVGASQIAFEVLKVLGADGVFTFTGVPGRGKGPVQIDTDLIMRNLVLKNQVVLGTVNAGQDAFQNAIRDLAVFNARWPKAVRALITGRFPIERFRDPIFAREGIKNVVELAA